MKKFDIAILTEIVNYHSGARASLEIAKHMARRGNKVTVYAYDIQVDDDALNDLRKNQVNVTIIKLRRFPQIARLIASLSLFNILRKNSHQLLIFSGTLAFFFAGKSSGIPIIRIYMGTQFNAVLEDGLPNQPKSIFVKTLNTLGNLYVLSREVPLTIISNGFIAISKYAAREAERLYKRKADATIYLGTTDFKKRELAKKNKKNITILSVSRITPYKGFHLMIDALKKVKTKKKLNFIIAGSQPKQEYTKYLKEKGGSKLIIYINPTDSALSMLYQKADIYLCADHYLHFGLPIFEAAQYEIPTLSLNLGAAHELIQHEKTGFVAENQDEFSEYLKTLIEDDKLRNKLGYNALKWSKNFTWEKCAEKWEKIIAKYARYK